MNRFADGMDVMQSLAPPAERGYPGGAASGEGTEKHQHADDAQHLIGKDASGGHGSQHSRQPRPDSGDIEGKDGGLNRAGDERGWNARQQPRDAHGRFIADRERTRTAPPTESRAS